MKGFLTSSIRRFNLLRMELTVTIPDDLAERLGANEIITRRALEGFALEEFPQNRIGKPEVRRLLGLETRDALDGFLKAHGVYETYSAADLDQEREDLRRLGL